MNGVFCILSHPRDTSINVCLSKVFFLSFRLLHCPCLPPLTRKLFLLKMFGIHFISFQKKANYYYWENKSHLFFSLCVGSTFKPWFFPGDGWLTYNIVILRVIDSQSKRWCCHYSIAIAMCSKHLPHNRLNQNFSYGPWFIHHFAFRGVTDSKRIRVLFFGLTCTFHLSVIAKVFYKEYRKCSVIKILDFLIKEMHCC